MTLAKRDAKIIYKRYKDPKRKFTYGKAVCSDCRNDNNKKQYKEDPEFKRYHQEWSKKQHLNRKHD